MQTLELPVAGGTLACFRLAGGDADADPRLPRVLAVHGITSNSRSWVAVARALDGAAELVAVDLRGRGDSRDLPGPYGLAAHARDLLDVLDSLGWDTAVLLGHSLGAYIVARLAAEHPERARAAVLVDGGLKIPGTGDVDPIAFTEAFLGPALARLRMTFESRAAYLDWWRAHPAFAGGEVAQADLESYCDHDLVGTEPELRSSVAEAAVREDAVDLIRSDEHARDLEVPSVLLCAPRGLLNEPNPMQPLELAQAWAAAAPELREAVPVPGTNHYTIALGADGAGSVAAAVQRAAAAASRSRSSSV